VKEREDAQCPQERDRRVVGMRAELEMEEDREERRRDGTTEPLDERGVADPGQMR